ncbi:hypothetical protein ACFE04_005948 [Oxalis oulophora]
MKRFERNIKREVKKIFGKKRRPPPPPPLPPPPPPPPSPTPPPSPPPSPPPNFPFLFPKAESTVLPEPSPLFSPSLLTSPLPTNSFFQNFTLKNGDQPEYIHPYLVKSALSSLSVCYPSQFHSPSVIYQTFTPDLTFSALDQSIPQKNHIISSYSDFSVTLDMPYSNLRFFLVRGTPFVTCEVTCITTLSISTTHEILSVDSNQTLTKHTIKLKNNQTWLLYSSSPLNINHDLFLITTEGFAGVLRTAILPDEKVEAILDQHSICYPTSGDVAFTQPFCMEYKWKTKGWGDLLMLAHPLHIQILSGATVLENLKYKSIDGDLVGVVGNSWVLKPKPVSITWHSIKGIKEEAYTDIISALCIDVEGLKSTPITTTSSYSYGKLIARAARLGLIAEEVGFLEVIPAIKKFLMDAIEPWLTGTYNGNGFEYDAKWGGIVTKQGSTDEEADFGFGVYNGHHHHLGYFLYAIAVLAKLDPIWGRKYKPEAYSLMADFMNLGRQPNSKYPRLRNFDLYKLHSWSSGLNEFIDGRNQGSSSEAVNAYYSAALLGLAYGDAHLVTTGSILAAMEIQAAQTWWHVKNQNDIYEEDFTKENRVVSTLWANKRDSAHFFAPSEWRVCRLGIQILPLSPITEILFCDVGFVRELVEWAMGWESSMDDAWKGFVFAMEGVYDKESALEKTRRLNNFDDGNSLTNLLWWIHSRSDEEGHGGGGKYCWFGYYCH